jgi:hypothetical protein
MIRAKQKVYLHRQWLNWEIIRSKCFSKLYRSCFFHIVLFELELTSYLQYLSLPLWGKTRIQIHSQYIYVKCLCIRSSYTVLLYANASVNFWCYLNLPILVLLGIFSSLILLLTVAGRVCHLAPMHLFR